MLAYSFKEDIPKPVSLSQFSDDEVYCTGFSPSTKDIRQIKSFIADLKKTFPLEKHVSLYLSFKAGLYLGDIKAYLGQEPTFANSSHSHLKLLLESLKSYLIINSVYEIDKGFRYFN